MEIKNHKIRKVHIPRKLIFKNQIHEITNINRKFVIKGYKIKTVDDKIDMVIINNPHPNANPRTGEFCIPDNLRQHELNESAINMIDCILICFNLDDCYFTPWDEIEYKKQEVIGTWPISLMNK